MNLKKITSGVMALAMVASMAACGSKAETPSTPAETPSTPTTTPAETTPADDPNRPAAVSPEDWEAMKKEPVFGTQLNYMYNGGNCVSAQYVAEKMGYYAEYGIDATFVTGGDSAVAALGSNSIQWTIDHIATLLVPITNNVEYTFVNGAHIGCKSIYVLKDSPIQTAADLKGKTIAIHDGLGNSDHNIVARLCDEYGVDPTKDVELMVVETSATIAGMQNGEIDASIFGDTWAYDMVKSGELRMICSITFSPEFQDEPCCVVAMSNQFVKENPVHAKYVTMAIKRAGQFNRLNSEEAVNFMLEDSKLSGSFEKNIEIWDTLYFGLSDQFTKRALEEIASDYIRLGLITADMSVEEIMAKAWTPVCPDEEMPESYTVGDPVPVEGNVVAVQQKGEGSVDTPVASNGHLDSWEASTSGNWDAMFVPVEIEGRAIEYADFDLTPTAEELEAMKKEPAYGQAVQYWMSDGCTSGPTIADKLGFYAEAGLTAEGSKGGDTYTIALGTNKNHVAVGHIATMLVPCTNDVDLTFVGGAHIGCKSLYVLADSNYNTTADLKGTAISVPNGIGASDYNITSLLLDADGINPQTDVELMQVSTDACVAAMENGEISAALLSDTFAYGMVKDGKLKCIRSLLDSDFADNNCCVIAMSGQYVRENPVHAKKIVQAVQKAHSWMRENPEDATQMLIDLNMNSADYDMNVMLNNSLQFGLGEKFTEATLRETVETYVRLGLITSMSDVDAIMAKAWTPVLGE